MAINQEFPVLDGVAPSWCDLTAKATFNGAPVLDMADIKSINTGTTLEVGELRGPGGRVRKRTSGSVKNEASIELYMPGWHKLIKNLGALAPARGNQFPIGQIHWGISYFFSVQGDDEIYETRIKGVRYCGRDKNTTEGNDAIVVPCKLSVADIVDMVDGKEIVLL